jgi:uncharacterized membrane protein
MEDIAVARAVHVLGVILRIGGVAMVTTVLLPETRALRSPAERLAWFEAVEGRFAVQARWTTLLTGASGVYLVHALGLWGRFADGRFWWMHAMVGIWLIFTLMLFVLEPLVLHRLFSERARLDPEGTFAAVTRVHWVLLVLSLVTVAGAVAGSHGWLI